MWYKSVIIVVKICINYLLAKKTNIHFFPLIIKSSNRKNSNTISFSLIYYYEYILRISCCLLSLVNVSFYSIFNHLLRNIYSLHCLTRVRLYYVHKNKLNYVVGVIIINCLTVSACFLSVSMLQIWNIKYFRPVQK